MKYDINIDDEEVRNVFSRDDVQEAIAKVVNSELEGLKAKRTSLLKELSDLKPLKETVDQLGGIDNLRTLAEQKPKKIIPDNELERERSHLTEIIKSKDGELTDLRNSIVNEKLGNTISSALAKAGADDLLVPFIKERIRGEFKDTGVQITVMTEDNVPLITPKGEAATIDDLLEEFKKSDRFKKLFKGKNFSGTGTNPGDAPASIHNPFDMKSPEFNLTKAMEFYKQNPEKAKVLAEQVGFKLSV